MLNIHGWQAALGASSKVTLGSKYVSSFIWITHNYSENKINIHKASYNPELQQKEQLAIHF